MYRASIDPKAAVSDPALVPYFTGLALQLVLTSPDSSPELEVRAVFFGAGVRSQWHRHPYPQIISVLSGVVLLGIDGAEQELRPGEVITLPAQAWHWHGALEDTEAQMLSIMRPGPIQWRESLEDNRS